MVEFVLKHWAGEVQVISKLIAVSISETDLEFCESWTTGGLITKYTNMYFFWCAIIYMSEIKYFYSNLYFS